MDLRSKQEELIREITDLKMENATLRAELKAMGKRVDELEKENTKLTITNEILNRK